MPGNSSRAVVQALDRERCLGAREQRALDQRDLSAQACWQRARLDVLEQFARFVLAAFDIGQRTVEQPLVDVQLVARQLSDDLRPAAAEQIDDDGLAVLRVAPHARIGGEELFADLPGQRDVAAMRSGVATGNAILHRLQGAHELIGLARG